MELVWVELSELWRCQYCSLSLTMSIPMSAANSILTHQQGLMLILKNFDHHIKPYSWLPKECSISIHDIKSYLMQCLWKIIFYYTVEITLAKTQLQNFVKSRCNFFLKGQINEVSVFRFTPNICYCVRKVLVFGLL